MYHLWTFVQTDNGTRTRKSDIPYETACIWQDQQLFEVYQTESPGSGVRRVRAIAIALYNLERDSETILLKTHGEFKPVLSWTLPSYSCDLEVDTVISQNGEIKTKPETRKSCCFLKALIKRFCHFINWTCAPHYHVTAAAHSHRAVIWEDDSNVDAEPGLKEISFIWNKYITMVITPETFIQLH